MCLVPFMICDHYAHYPLCHGLLFLFYHHITKELWFPDWAPHIQWCVRGCIGLWFLFQKFFRRPSQKYWSLPQGCPSLQLDVCLQDLFLYHLHWVLLQCPPHVIHWGAGVNHSLHLLHRSQLAKLFLLPILLVVPFTKCSICNSAFIKVASLAVQPTASPTLSV